MNVINVIFLDIMILKNKIIQLLNSYLNQLNK